MSKYYYIRSDQTFNPGLHHEVHTERHANELLIINKQPIGSFNDGIEAVEKAKTIFDDADGCPICCPEAHKG